MRQLDYPTIVADAWQALNPDQPILEITDISVRVSTNYVYKVQLTPLRFVIAKLSYFGKYEHFCEDHTLVNALVRNLEAPFKKFLARSYTLDGNVFTYRYRHPGQDVWVVFYRPVRIREKLPRRLGNDDIVNLAGEMARFHLACHQVAPKLPHSSKTLRSDMQDLIETLDTSDGTLEFGGHINLIRQHASTFLEQSHVLRYNEMAEIPVFVDWNIGNFSLNKEGKLYSRWDYDWFRVCNRVMDFYFLSRVVSDVGDRTMFHYLPDTLHEERFLLFLKTYHAIFPLTENEIRFMKEIYRFFILQYVVKFGNYFFHHVYASRLQQEAFTTYLPQLDARMDVEKILRACNL